MIVRSWAVGVVSTAALVAGVVAVQSGIPGTAALPVLPHRAAPTAGPDGDAELPVPVEVGGPQPTVGPGHEVAPTRAADVSRWHAVSPPGQAKKGAEHSGKDSDSDRGKSSGKSGKDSDDTGSDDRSGKD